MFPIAPNGSQTPQNINGQRHCILVAASNPYPLLTPVYQPQNLEQSENFESQTESRLSDAETVAKSFAQCCISLSVICPKQLPKLRAIYNAGKHNPRAADPAVDNVKNPQFLVLISENFMEARAALSCPGVTSLASNHSHVKMDLTSVPAVTEPPPTSMLSGVSPETSTMIFTPEMPQQVQSGMQSLGVKNNSAANMPLSQQTSSALQSAHPKYIKVWEGNLSVQRQGQPIFITRLVGYRSPSDSETLAANWPQTIQMVHVTPQAHMNNKKFVEKADLLVFRAMYKHEILGQLQERKLCAVIQLPSKILLLSVTDTDYVLMGMLLPGDISEFKSQISSQQQQQQQLQQQQQQQMQSLQQQQQHSQLQPAASTLETTAVSTATEKR